MPGRKFVSGEEYRFGFNGKEDDRDWGTQNIQDYGFRLYNPSIGKFLSVDIVEATFPMLTPYQFASNNPVGAIDLEGLQGVLIAFSGGVFGEGELVDYNSPDSRGAAVKMARDVSLAGKGEGIDIRSAAIYTGPKEATLETAMNFLKENLRKGDKIVIYGYSAGGVRALQFLRELKENPETRSLVVNDVILVDPAMGPWSMHVDRNIEDNVKYITHYYQTTSSPIGSRGYPLTLSKSSPRRQILGEQEVANSDHAGIPLQVFDQTKDIAIFSLFPPMTLEDLENNNDAMPEITPLDALPGLSDISSGSAAQSSGSQAEGISSGAGGGVSGSSSGIGKRIDYK